MSARRCNQCTLCCKLLPVSEIGKPANTLCSQQRSKGCRVHGTAAYPRACRIWSCGWLQSSVPLPRPDRAGYVIDPSPDFVLINGATVPVIQIWVDPRRPEAHRDVSLRAWLAAQWDAHGELAIVRLDSTESIVLFPPAIVGAGENHWIEACGPANSTEHTPAEISARVQRVRTQAVESRRDWITKEMRAAIKLK